MSVDLEQLLARAVSLEAKGTAGGVETPGDDGELEESLLASSSEPGTDPLADFEAEEDGVDFDDWGDGTDGEEQDAEDELGGAPVELLDAVTPTGEAKAAGWEPCPDCGSTDVDAYADGTARCEDCGTRLVAAGAAEEKGYDFDGFDLLVEGKADGFVRDEAGKFDFASSGARRDGGKGKDDDDEGGDSPAIAKVRDRIRSWSEVPAGQKAALKKQLLATVRGEATTEQPRERLIALIEGLGDGDGKAEAGEGSAAALRGGKDSTRDFLRDRGKDAGVELETKADDLDLEDLLRRRAALG